MKIFQGSKPPAHPCISQDAGTPPSTFKMARGFSRLQVTTQLLNNEPCGQVRLTIFGHFGPLKLRPYDSPCFFQTTCRDTRIFQRDESPDFISSCLNCMSGSVFGVYLASSATLSICLAVDLYIFICTFPNTHRCIYLHLVFFNGTCRLMHTLSIWELHKGPQFLHHTKFDCIIRNGMK